MQSINLPMNSLQKLTVFRITTTLCNNFRVLRVLKGIPGRVRFRLYAKDSIEWGEFQAEANRLISELHICSKFKSMVTEMLWPLYYKMNVWLALYVPSSIPTTYLHFYWTDNGRIDTVRTTEFVIQNKTISIRWRFGLACCAGLGKEIREIWTEMTKEDKELYVHKISADRFMPLFRFWEYILERGGPSHFEYRILAMACAVCFGLFEAVKCLFRTRLEAIYPCQYFPHEFEKENIYLAEMCYGDLKLNLEKEDFLDDDEIDIGYFVFSITNGDNQLLLEASDQLTLALTLHSTESCHILKELSKTPSHIDGYEMQTFLKFIFLNFCFKVYEDHDYLNLFIDVWEMIPEFERDCVKSRADSIWNFRSLNIKPEMEDLLNRTILEDREENDWSFECI